MSDTPPTPAPKPEPKPNRNRGPAALHLVITDEDVTVFGQEVEALRFAFGDNSAPGARYVRAERGFPVSLKR